MLTVGVGGRPGADLGPLVAEALADAAAVLAGAVGSAGSGASAGVAAVVAGAGGSGGSAGAAPVLAAAGGSVRSGGSAEAAAVVAGAVGAVASGGSAEDSAGAVVSAWREGRARPDAVATIDRRAAEAALVAAAYGCPLVTYTAAELAARPVPAPSGAVAAAVGAPSVAEAAALLAAGPGARLLIGKRGNGSATVAVAVTDESAPAAVAEKPAAEATETAETAAAAEVPAGDGAGEPAVATATGSVDAHSDTPARAGDGDGRAGLVEFWSERHLCTLTTLRADGSPHVVPVGATLDPATMIARVITSGSSRKAVHARVPGARVALCQVDGRRWSTLEGTAVVKDDPASVGEAVRRYTQRYRPPRDNPRRVVIEIHVTRVLGNV